LVAGLLALSFMAGGAASAQEVAPTGSDEGAAPDVPLLRAPAPGQSVSLVSAVVTLDQDALFAGSAFGQRVQEQLERDRNALTRENRRIEAELVEEELALTEKRDSTPVTEFTRIANEFDEKVQQVRQAQDGKSVLLQQRLEQERQSFWNEAGPAIAEVMRRRGALVVIDRNAILLAFDGVDITQEAIAEIDAAIGAGERPALPLPPPAQRPSREITDVAPAE